MVLLRGRLLHPLDMRALMSPIFVDPDAVCVRKRFLEFMVQVTFLYYKILSCSFWQKFDGGPGGTATSRRGTGWPPARDWLATREAWHAARPSPGAYLIPVVAMPLMRNLCPKRKTRKTGNRDTMDIAKSEPQLVADCESTNARSATGTVNMSGSVR